MSAFDDEPTPGVGAGDTLYPASCLNHLLLVWFINYIEHSPTVYSTPGKNSDVIVVDVVDLDLPDDDGYQGKVFRGSWWRNGRLIGFGKPRLGRPKPVIATMAFGGVTMGNKPYELHTQDHDPGMVARGSAWLQAHTDFRPTIAGQTESGAVPVPQVRQKSQLEILADQQLNRAPHQQVLRDASAGGGSSLPPPPRPAQDIDAPF